MGSDAVSDRYCPNCQQNVSPRGHGCAAQLVWTVVGLPIALIAAIAIAGVTNMGGGAVTTVQESGQAVQVHNFLIYGIYLGLAIWAVGILLELTVYRLRCPLCRTTGLGSSR